MKSNGMGSGMWFCISYFAIQFNTQLEARTMRETLRHRDTASMRHNVSLFSFLRGLSQTADRGANCHPSYDSKISASFNPTGEILCASQNGVSTTAWRDRHIGRFPAILNHSWLPLRSPESPSQNTAGSEPARQFSYQPPSTKLPASQFLLSSGLIAPYSCSFCPVVPLSEQVNWAVLPLSTE